jgi:hypothetical protein
VISTVGGSTDWGGPLGVKLDPKGFAVTGAEDPFTTETSIVPVPVYDPAVNVVEF